MPIVLMNSRIVFKIEEIVVNYLTNVVNSPTTILDTLELLESSEGRATDNFTIGLNESF